MPNPTHGMSETREYAIWLGIKQRCTNPARNCYDRYGARGITMCANWMKSFAAFYAHIGPSPAPGYTVDRIDNERGYEPGNVRWATRAEQSRNTSKNVFLTVDGETKTVSEWARIVGMSQYTIFDRIKHGVPESQLLSRGRVKYVSNRPRRRSRKQFAALAIGGTPSAFRAASAGEEKAVSLSGGAK